MSMIRAARSRIIVSSSSSAWSTKTDFWMRFPWAWSGAAGEGPSDPFGVRPGPGNEEAPPSGGAVSTGWT